MLVFRIYVYVYSVASVMGWVVSVVGVVAEVVGSVDSITIGSVENVDKDSGAGVVVSGTMVSTGTSF